MVPPSSTQLSTSKGIIGLVNAAQLMEGNMSDLRNAVIFEAAPGGATRAANAAASPGAGALAPVAAAGVGAGNRAIVLDATKRATNPWTKTSSPQVIFSIHDHPHVCAFIKTLNWKGVPALLALKTQQRSNDGRVISGFTPSMPNDLVNPYVIGLTGGALYAQGQLYQTPAGFQPDVPQIDPARDSTSLFLFCDPSRYLYYTPEMNANTPGDALILNVLTDGRSFINQVIPASSIIQPTIFPQTYHPRDLVLF